ncbi:hypothetical protein [Carboxylicivirga sp. RSCT41]|uniref:hypothetical protein n=1 Tax=Carboxylicivirga agarovorans TaxID=3417570 RepID=UPI003D340030
MLQWKRVGKDTYSFKNPYNFRSDINALTEEEITWAVDYHVDTRRKHYHFKRVAHWPVHVLDNRNWPYHIAIKMLESIVNTFDAGNINYAATLECLKAIDNKKKDKSDNELYDDETCNTMAQRLVPVLSCCAYKEETISFKKLDYESGLDIGKKVAYPLKYLREYTMKHYKIDLACIVTTPDGFPVRFYSQFPAPELKAMRQKVFEHDWITQPVEVKWNG